MDPTIGLEKAQYLANVAARWKITPTKLIEILTNSSQITLFDECAWSYDRYFNKHGAYLLKSLFESIIQNHHIVIHNSFEMFRFLREEYKNVSFSDNNKHFVIVSEFGEYIPSTHKNNPSHHFFFKNINYKPYRGLLFLILWCEYVKLVDLEK